MKFKASGTKQGFPLTLTYADAPCPLEIENGHALSLEQELEFFDQLCELSRTSRCFSGATPLDDDDVVKLMWMASAFFDDEPVIETDEDLSELTEPDDESIVY